MSGRPKPADIAHAVRVGNRPFLQAAGRKGGFATARRRARERAVERHFAERRAKVEQERREETNEHIIPVDPLDPNTPDSYR